MNTSEVLNKAADLIEERGWGQGPVAMLGPGGLCAMGAMGLALTGERTDNYAHINDCAAGRAVSAYLEDRTEPFVADDDRIWSWNDDCESAAEVIEVLRAAALIEQARESGRVDAEVSA